STSLMSKLTSWAAHGAAITAGATQSQSSHNERTPRDGGVGRARVAIAVATSHAPARCGRDVDVMFENSPLNAATRNALDCRLALRIRRFCRATQCTEQGCDLNYTGRRLM